MTADMLTAHKLYQKMAKMLVQHTHTLASFGLDASGLFVKAPKCYMAPPAYFFIVFIQ